LAGEIVKMRKSSVDSPIDSTSTSPPTYH